MSRILLTRHPYQYNEVQKFSGNNQYSDNDITEWLAMNRSARILTFVDGE
jgi:hypothetical protein